MTQKNRVAIGVLWNFAEQISRRGVAMLVTLILAYFLTPKDFGLLAIVAGFLAAANTLMDSGLKEALIRLKEPSSIDLETVFCTSLVLAIFAYIIVFSIAQTVADFYNEQRLLLMLRVAALVIFSNALQTIPAVILLRQLNFSAQFKVSFIASVCSSILAIVSAFFGIGVWALVIQIVLASVIGTVLLWRMNLWRSTFRFGVSSLKNLYGFGYRLFLSYSLEIFFSNMYVLIIAKIFSSTTAGLYFIAEKIRDIIVGQLVGSIEAVTYPALSSLKEDEDQLKMACRKVVVVTTFFVFPVMLFISALAIPLFEVFAPERWWPAAGYVQLMCIGGCLYPLHAINLNILKIKGRSDLFLQIEVAKKLLSVVIVLFSFRFGIYGIIIGQITGSVPAYLMNSNFSSKLIGYTRVEQMSDFFPTLSLAAFVAFGLHLAVKNPYFSEMAAVVVLGIGATFFYIAFARLLRMRGYMLAVDVLTGFSDKR